MVAPRWPLLALAASSAATVAATYGPWLHSGRSVRSSYAVARAVDRLDVAHGVWGQVVGVAWPFAPLLGALAVLAVVLGVPRAAAALGAALGSVTIAFAVAVVASPFASAWGADAALVGSALLLGAALVTVVTDAHLTSGTGGRRRSASSRAPADHAVPFGRGRAERRRGAVATHLGPASSPRAPSPTGRQSAPG